MVEGADAGTTPARSSVCHSRENENPDAWRPLIAFQPLEEFAPTDAAEGLSVAWLPAKSALADLDRAEHALPRLDPELNGRAKLGDVPRLQRYVSRVLFIKRSDEREQDIVAAFYSIYGDSYFPIIFRQRIIAT